MQLTGTLFSDTSALLGNGISTFPDYPAEIRAPQGTVAGVSGFQVHFGSHRELNPGDYCDVLVAMNPAALKANRKWLKQGATDRADYSLWFEKAPDKAETWLAKLRSRTVGQLVLGAGDTQNSGVILDLSLDEAYRGRCFGQQLLGQAVSVLRNCGAREIQVSVPDANARAAHFFAENGFVPQTPGGAVLFKDIEVCSLP